MATFVEQTGTANPFDGVDVGFFSAPTFADIDGDGDLDAFIGEIDGIIKYFENDGSGNFTEVTGIDNPLDGVNGIESSPTFADIDDDGDLDAFIGQADGIIKYFENDGSGNFTEVTGIDNPLDGVDVGDYSSPTFADIDGDGDLDAFIGEIDGNINYFENDGSGNFTEVTGIDNPLDGVDLGNFSAPTFADIDGDGDLDAFIGETYGTINYFENDGSGNFTEVTGTANPFDGVDVGDYSSPTFADIDGDGDLDAFIGEGYGTIKYFENTTPPPTNNPPVAVDDSATTDEDSLLSGNVLTNDSDADSDTLTVTEVNGNAAGVGTQVTLTSGALLTLNIDGTFDYDPNGQFESLNNGETDSDSFTYTIDDGNGGTDTATVNVTIDGVTDNTAPDAVDDAVTTDEDSVLSSGNVLTNDSDADSDTLTVTEVNGNAAGVGTQVTLTSGALLTLNIDGTFDYDPNGQFESLNNGETDSDSFTYTIDDGNGGTDTATVNVTIDGVTDNTAPDAVDDAVTTDEDSLLSSGNVLTNDSDADSDTLTVTEVNGNAAGVGTQVTLTSGALLTLNIDGTFDYDPNGQFESLNNGETDSDSFTYTIDDGNGGTDTATVNVTIDGVTDNTAPDAVDDAVTTDEDSLLSSGNVLTND
ncbi:MAG: tandem-95 repeat protein, partial [Okeania sp. SIO2C9]|uniref:Ig-like domain-containing protein n=1 Tax=Okeania sp. SIO2C9 TaxID=2607791 RepID=UPI0013C20F34